MTKTKTKTKTGKISKKISPLILVSKLRGQRGITNSFQFLSTGIQVYNDTAKF